PPFPTSPGVPPKWVIQRSRLHEAVERLDHDNHIDLGFLARDLGYFDQAHFTRAFRATVGHPPPRPPPPHPVTPTPGTNGPSWSPGGGAGPAPCTRGCGPPSRSGSPARTT